MSLVTDYFLLTSEMGDIGPKSFGSQVPIYSTPELVETTVILFDRRDRESRVSCSMCLTDQTGYEVEKIDGGGAGYII